MNIYALSKLGNLVPILQMAIGPVILISGVGLLILAMTKQCGRVIDRKRKLLAEYANLDAMNTLEIKKNSSSLTIETQKNMIKEQLQILGKRARLNQFFIIGTSLSALSAAIMIIIIFLGVVTKVPLGLLVVLVFVVCLLSLIISLILFMIDVHLSLHAVNIEMEAYKIN